MENWRMKYREMGGYDCMTDAINISRDGRNVAKIDRDSYDTVRSFDDEAAVPNPKMVDDAEFIVTACNSYDKTQQAMSIALRTINDTLRHELLTDGGRDSLIVAGVELKGLIDKEAGS